MWPITRPTVYPTTWLTTQPMMTAATTAWLATQPTGCTTLPILTLMARSGYTSAPSTPTLSVCGTQPRAISRSPSRTGGGLVLLTSLSCGPGLVCRAGHAEHCQGSSQGGRPRRLIDVERWCVVPAVDHPYVTLSYVWGRKQGNKSVELTDCTARELGSPGGLKKEELPITIVQTMEAVRRLGEMYLWIDRLCINQSGSHCEDRKDEMADMADIYAGSVFTIVAAQGKDAMDPLWMGELVDTSWEAKTEEVSAIERERVPRQDIVHSLARSLVQSAWCSRGWTFQEYHFSRRKLIFCGDTIVWECHCASWHETQHLDEEDQGSCGKHAPNETGFDLDPWPNFHRFARMLCLFNARMLTYPEDALHAVDGALSALSAVFDGGFVSGLPQSMFDAALLWQPYYPMARRQRRKQKAKRAACPEDAILPSWSPLGWHGSVYSENWVAGCSPVWESDPQLQQQCAYTVSTVQWFYEYRDGDLRTWLPINVSTEHWRRRFSSLTDGEASQALLGGWSFDVNSGFFTHISDPAQHFWYPIPICDPQSPRPRPVLTPYIRGMTRSAHFTAVPKGSVSKGNCAQALLRTEDGVFAGFIRLNENGSNTEKRSCLLVELSRGETKKGHDGFTDRYVEFEFADELGIMEDRPYAFVNVMWVEMSGEIAERVAVGRVKVAVWEVVAREKEFTFG